MQLYSLLLILLASYCLLRLAVGPRIGFSQLGQVSVFKERIMSLLFAQAFQFQIIIRSQF